MIKIGLDMCGSADVSLCSSGRLSAPITHTYDNNGNLLTQISSSGITTYVWDQENRLKSYIGAGAAVPTTYTYSDEGHRQTTITGSEVTQYVWDEDIVLLEIDNIEGTRTQYTQGPGEWGMLVSQQVNTTTTYLGSDDRNNVRLLLPQAGIGTSANYKAFGSTLPTPGTPATPFQYGGNVGYYAESPTAGVDDTEFYRTLHRIYRFHSGRFPQPDPTGINGGYNLYGYANNNPISWIDPAGTDPRSNVHRKPAQHAHAASSAQRLIHSFVTGVRSVSPVWFDSDNGLVIGPQDHPFLAFDASPMSHGYFRQVGDVFEGYGNDLNPVEWLKGLSQLVHTARHHGLSAAGSAIWNGTIHGYTDWINTSDPQTFGESFGIVLLTVAPAIKKIPMPKVFGSDAALLKSVGAASNTRNVATSGSIELYHYTSGSNARAIMDSGEIRGSSTVGLWRLRTGDVYLTTDPRAGTLKLLGYGLSPKKHQVVVPVDVRATDVAVRPFGIRIVSGPVKF